MGVTYFKRYRMEIDLRGRHFEAVRAPLGYRLIPWSPDLLEDHVEAKLHSFREEIDSDIFPCLGEWDGCHKLMNEIANKDGFLAEATWLAISLGDGSSGNGTDENGTDEPEPCGTIQGIRVSRHYGGIQNVGITPPHRGRGIGSCLIAATLSAFQQVGLQRAYLEVTAQNERAIELYRRMGFRRTKTLYKAVELAYS